MGAGDEGLPPPELPQGTPAASDVEDPKDTTNSLSIKVTNAGTKKGKDLLPTPLNSSGVNLLISTKSKKISSESASPHVNSPLVSPASSAFASALQSPYISPRALAPPTPPPQQKNTPPLAHLPSPPVSYCGSQSDDIPSSSYTPPPERSDFSDDPTDEKPKFVACIPVQDHAAAPRISFSFQVPRISFARGSSVSPASNAKLRSCDVYIGYRGQNPNLVRFCKWLKSELELQGIACFVADRAKYADSQSHEIADRVICSVTFGLVVVTGSSFLNHLSMEEIRFFSQKKNLIPLFFDQRPTEVLGLLNQNSIDKDSKEAIDGLMKCHEFKLEVNECNWRHCISKAAAILTAKLGRKRVSKQEVEGNEELPFPRNAAFLGREKEITEIGTAFFGSADFLELDCATSNIRPASTSESEDRAVYAEHKKIMRGATYIDMEMGTCKEPNLEAWIEPAIERGSCRRQKYRKPKSANNRSFGSSIVCISGVAGVGKTELALEFAYRNLQRYKMVLWVGSEARYFRQNILNLSSCLGLDVTADTEKERRIRSFDEQEFEAFKRVKREMFCDMPYLIILDNLETEKEWWDGKDLHDLIPRNTGGSHVIITTRLSKVPNYDIMQLLPLPMTDAMILLRGRRKKDYPAEEMEYLTKFDEKLKRSTFGLSVIGSLLSEFAIPPSSLFEAVNQTMLDEGSSDCSCLSISDEQFCRNNPFLMKTMTFCTAFLQQSSERRNHLASRMLLVGAWFAPAPISVNLLATAAKNMAGTGNRLKKWAKCLRFKVCCTSGCNFGAQSWNSEEDDSTHLLVKLGMARRANRQPGCWIQLHSITQILAKRNEGFAAAEATVHAIRKVGNPLDTPDHLWTSAFLVFGFKSEPPLVQLKAIDMVLFIKRIALPLALKAFATFSMCNSALELLKVCTNVLDEVEKSFVSQIQDWYDGSLCWKKKLQSNKRVDEYVWQEVTLLKATLLETRAQLLLRGGHFDSGEELCRTCIGIRTVMLGYNHAQTLAAQETLAKLVRSRSKI